MPDRSQNGSRRREVDDVFRDFSLTHQIGLKKSAPVEFGIRGGEKFLIWKLSALPGNPSQWPMAPWIAMLNCLSTDAHF